jgi:hypothetical protein
MPASTMMWPVSPAETMVRRTITAMTAVATHHPAVRWAETAVRRAGEVTAATGRRAAKPAEATVTRPATRIPPVRASSIRLPPIPAALGAGIAAGTRRRTAAIGRATIRRPSTATGVTVLRPGPGDDGVRRARAAENLHELPSQFAGVRVV